MMYPAEVNQKLQPGDACVIDLRHRLGFDALPFTAPKQYECQ